MPLSRWQATITDAAGNVVPSATVEVRREIAGAPLASLFSDRDGASAIGNPFSADAEGFAAFHVAGGAYRIDVSLGGFSRTWRYVGIGTAGERDFSLFVPMGAWDIATTYDTGQLVSHDDGGEPYSFVSNADGNLANEPQFDSGIGISDAHWTVVGLGETGLPGSSDVVGSSVSSVAIGTGTKSFTVVENNRGWGVGARLRISSDANPASHWMEGVVTAYAANTLQITADLAAGSGSRADWNINLAGEKGVSGAGDMVAANNLSDVADAATARTNIAAAGTGDANTFSQAQSIQALLDLSHASAGQIKFPSTPNPSADPTTLDAYKEDQFNPAMTFGGSGAGVTYDFVQGVYTKVGRLVTVHIRVKLTNNGSGSGAALITGLPFANTASYNVVGSAYLVAGGSSASGIKGVIFAGNSVVSLFLPGATADVAATDANCTNTFDFIFSATYQV